MVVEQLRCPALIAGDWSSSDQEQRRAARRSLRGFQELQQPQGAGLRLEEKPGEVFGRGKVAEAVLKGRRAG